MKMIVKNTVGPFIFGNQWALINQRDLLIRDNPNFIEAQCMNLVALGQHLSSCTQPVILWKKRRETYSNEMAIVEPI